MCYPQIIYFSFFLGNHCRKLSYFEMKIFGENLGCSFHGGCVLGTNVSSMIVVEGNQISSHERGAHVTEFGLYFVELNSEKSNVKL